MKKWLFILLLMVGFSIKSSAQYQQYTATSYAIAYIDQYSGQYRWSDWINCTVTVVFNLDKDIITIYSKKQQNYFITSTEGSLTDNGGGRQVVFKVIDQDRDDGHVRLRIENNGNMQIYVDFADVAWCYNVYREPS